MADHRIYISVANASNQESSYVQLLLLKERTFIAHSYKFR